MSGSLTVEELITAVTRTLAGCGGLLPTATPTASASPTQTPTARPEELKLGTGAQAAVNNLVALNFGLVGNAAGGAALFGALMRGGAASLPTGEVACHDPETGEMAGRVLIECIENPTGPTTIFTGSDCLLEPGVTFDGELRFTLPADFSCEAFALLVDGPIIDAQLRTNANASLRVTDLSSGEVFTRVFDSFAETELCMIDGTMVVSQEGATVLDCIGRVIIATVSNMVYGPGEVCPSSGELQLAVDDGVGRVRYGAGGDIALDVEADGSTDRVVPCGAPSLRGCF